LDGAAVTAEPARANVNVNVSAASVNATVASADERIDAASTADHPLPEAPLQREERKEERTEGRTEGRREGRRQERREERRQEQRQDRREDVRPEALLQRDVVSVDVSDAAAVAAAGLCQPTQGAAASA
jgi:hypothetical protein